MSIRHYAVVLYWDRSTGLYVADVPSLSVSTYGDSKHEAMEKVKEAIQVTVEGLKAIGQPLLQDWRNAFTRYEQRDTIAPPR